MAEPVSDKPGAKRVRIPTQPPGRMRGRTQEGMVESLRKTDRIDMRDLLVDGKPPTDYETTMANFRIARMANENYSTMAEYMKPLLEEFQGAERCTIYLQSKKRPTEQSIVTLEHRLTAIRCADKDCEFFEIDETSSPALANLNPEVLELRDLTFETRKPVIIDHKTGIRITFENLDMDNRDCDPKFLEPQEDGKALAMMPFYYREPGNPSGIVVFEGDLHVRGSELEDLWKTFWSANLTMAAAAQISQQLTHKFDAITILPKFRDFEADLTNSIRQLVRREIDNLYLMIIDLDFFKSINDSHGHPAGNRVLEAVAKTIKASVRSDDMVSRLGGEEFAVILRNVTSDEEALVIANRIREKVAENRVQVKDNGQIGVTCSIGVTPVNEIVHWVVASGNLSSPQREHVVGAIHELAFESADQGLYQAKNGGRNKVVFRRMEAQAPI